MKKLLFFFVIVALFCFSLNDVDVFEEEDPTLQFKIKIPKIKLPKLPKIKIKFPKVKKGFDKLWREVKNDLKKANKFLKENGIYDVALELLKTAGKEAAVAGCVAVEIPALVCQEIVNVVAQNL